MTFLIILIVLLSTYIVGAVISFIYNFSEMAKDINDNDTINYFLFLFTFVMAVIMAVGWPIVVFDYIKDYFSKENSND